MDFIPSPHSQFRLTHFLTSSIRNDWKKFHTRSVLISSNKIPSWIRVLKSLPEAVGGKQVSFNIYSELELKTIAPFSK